MEWNVLRKGIFECKLLILVLLESPCLLKKEVNKNRDFKLFIYDKWNYNHSCLTLSKILLLYSPQFLAILILINGIIFEEWRCIALFPLLFTIIRIGESIRHRNMNRYDKLFQNENQDNSERSITLAAHSTETIGEKFSLNEDIKFVIQDLFPNQAKDLLNLHLEKLNMFDLRDRLLLIDVILDTRNSLSEIVTKVALKSSKPKQHYWDFFANILDASERNLRNYAETRNWYSKRLDHPQILNRISHLQDFLSESINSNLKLKQLLKKGDFG